MNDFCSAGNCDGCPDRVVCNCLQVTEGELVQALTTVELRSVRDIRRHTGAGDGCTACHKALVKYLERHVYCAGNADLKAAV